MGSVCLKVSGGRHVEYFLWMCAAMKLWGLNISVNVNVTLIGKVGTGRCMNHSVDQDYLSTT